MIGFRYRNARQIITSPHHTLIRFCWDKNENSNEAVALATTSKVLQSEQMESKLETTTDDVPEEPTTCCMSGCANCVWLDYAEKLKVYYKDGGEAAEKQINEKVTDGNIRAFLLHELRTKKS